MSASLEPSELKTYLAVLDALIPALHHTTDRNSFDDDADESDDDVMEWEETGDAGVTQRCLRMINEARHVDSLLSLVLRSSDTAVLTGICSICHAFAVQNKFTVNNCR